MSQRWMAGRGMLAGTLLTLALLWPGSVARDDILRIEVRLTTNPGANVTAVCGRTKPCVIPISLTGTPDNPSIALELRPIGNIIQARIVEWVSEQSVSAPSDWSLGGDSFGIELDNSGMGSGATAIYLRTKGSSDSAWQNNPANDVSDLVFRRPSRLTTLGVVVRAGR